MSSSLRINKDFKHAPHFMTITVIDWIEIFKEPRYKDILKNSFQYCIDNKGLRLLEYVFMTNHIHFIAYADENSDGLDAIIRDFKKFTTLKIFTQLEKDNQTDLLQRLNSSMMKKRHNLIQIWQRENCAKVIQSEEFAESKIQYIWANPVRKGYVQESQQWLYSSAKQRLEGEGSEGIVLRCSDW